MPMVNGKKYPYTGKGMMDAAAAKKKKVQESGGRTMSVDQREAARDTAMARGNVGEKKLGSQYDRQARLVKSTANRLALSKRLKGFDNTVRRNISRNNAMDTFNKTMKKIDGKF